LTQPDQKGGRRLRCGE